MRLSGGNRSRTLHFQAVCLQSRAPSSHCRLQSPGKWRQHQHLTSTDQTNPGCSGLGRGHYVLLLILAPLGDLKGKGLSPLWRKPTKPLSTWEGPSQLVSPLRPKPMSLTETDSNRRHLLHMVTRDCNPSTQESTARI